MKTHLTILIALATLCGSAQTNGPVNIGRRRELFLDNLMVQHLEGGAQRVFHHPVPREVVITFDKPWEGNACGYVTVFRDGDRYRMYYRLEFYEIGDVRLRRYTLRLDGFASIHAPTDGGELITPPVIFKGSRLSMNFASSVFGSLRVEIQDADGKPIPGFTLDDSVELYGDTVARNAIWKNDPNLGALAGKPVRLRFVMRDAGLYSIKFEETK